MLKLRRQHKLLNIAKFTESKKNAKRQSVPDFVSPLDFAEKERVLSYTGFYSYLKKILLETSQKVIICKGAQVGFSEGMINVSLYYLHRRSPVLYMLPAADEVSDFSAGRVNPAIEECQIFQGKCDVHNVHHKLIGGISFYLRGAQSRSKLKNIPVAVLILDEYDEMDEAMVLLARERLSGHLVKQEFCLSTPRLPDVGIYKDYKESDQENYAIRCCHCGSRQILTLEENLVGEQLICSGCGAEITHREKLEALPTGEWVLTQSGNGVPGYHLSQFYSPTVTGAEIGQALKKVEESGSEIQKQEFYNSKLGLPYEAKGARLSGELIDSRVGELPGERPRFAGIDVSQVGLHYAIIGSNTEYGVVIEEILRLPWESLATELKNRGVRLVVIDANPERKMSRGFVEAFGDGFMAMYPSRKKMPLYEENEETRFVDIDRTEAIDTVVGRFKTNNILIKNNLPQYGVLKNHLTNLVRQYREVRGAYEAYYTETGPDHYAHALVYCEIASRLQPAMVENIPGRFI